MRGLVGLEERPRGRRMISKCKHNKRGGGGGGGSSDEEAGICLLYTSDAADE